MKHSIIKYLILPILLLSSTITYAQSEWEEVNSIYFTWGSNSNVKIGSKSLSKLNFWNYHPESAANVRNNTWDCENIEMKITWKETRAWEITFKITNINNRHDYKYRVIDSNGKKRWHLRDIYWGYTIEAHTTGNKIESYTEYYCNHKKPYIDSYTSVWNSDNNSWSGTNDRGYRTVTIAYDGKSQIRVTTDRRTHTFYNTNSLASISICAGNAAEIMVTDFTAKRKSLYTVVKPHISSGDMKYQQKDYWGAASEYSKAIDKGHRNYDIFYRRASAYYAAEFYNNAIDDFTRALYYKQTEKAYFYRGVAKLAKKDASGIEDLKKGGSQGLAYIREYEIDSATSPGTQDTYSKYIASGTGFFIDPNGYIITNHHVIEKAKGIDVFVTESSMTSTYNAKTVIIDKSNDLAILKITDSAFARLDPIPYTIGIGTKDVGTSVFAMGYPQLSYLGDEIKVTDGIISSKSGYQGDVTTYQISAPIQSGNSGGPLFDKNGHVIGITNAGVSGLDNVGYAIKISYITNLIEAASESIVTPTANLLKELPFTEQIKKISPYVVIIKIY